MPPARAPACHPYLALLRCYVRCYVTHAYTSACLRRGMWALCSASVTRQSKTFIFANSPNSLLSSLNCHCVWAPAHRLAPAQASRLPLVQFFSFSFCPPLPPPTHPAFENRGSDPSRGRGRGRRQVEQGRNLGSCRAFIFQLIFELFVHMGFRVCGHAGPGRRGARARGPVVAYKDSNLQFTHPTPLGHHN